MAQKYRYKIKIGNINGPWTTAFYDEGFNLIDIEDNYKEYHVFFQNKIYSFYNKNYSSIGKEMNQIFLNETRKQKLSQSQFTA